MFSTLARFGDAIEHADVSLKHLHGGLQSVVCVISVTLVDGTRGLLRALMSFELRPHGASRAELTWTMLTVALSRRLRWMPNNHTNG